MNAHDAVIDAILTVLREDPPLCDDAEFIAEDLDLGVLPKDVAAAISVTFVGSDPGRAGILGAPVDWTTQIGIECWARRDQRNITEGRASRALHAQAYARLMEDATLGGLVFDILEPTLRADSEAHLTRAGACIGVYPIIHRTQARSLGA